MTHSLFQIKLTIMDRLLIMMKSLRQGTIPCLFHLLTGYYCPGCGGTRAVIALLRGDFLLSFLYHPLVLYGVTAGAFFGAARGLAVLTGRKELRPPWRMAYLYIGIFLIVLNFLVKNGLLFFFETDLLRILDRMI